MNIRTSLSALVLGLVCGLPLLAGSAAASAANAPSEGRVVVLGFDGASGPMAEKLMDEGQLPHLAKLREQGTFAPLRSTHAAESPVAWASLNSGRNPSETGIVGFVRRDLTGGSPMPMKALTEDDVTVPMEDFRDRPYGGLSGNLLPAAYGGGALLVFLLVFGLLLRLKPAVTITLAVLLGAVGAYTGWSAAAALPPSMPVVKNPLAAAPFWELAAAAGVPSVVLDGGQTWDRDPVDGARVLCGLGVPDARGQYISYFVYTTDELYFARKNDKDSNLGNGGKKFRVDEVEGKITSSIYGPPNFVEIQKLKWEQDEIARRRAAGEYSYKESEAVGEREKELKTRIRELEDNPLTVPLTIAKHGDGTADVAIGSESQKLSEGEWSDWYHLSFEMNSLISAHAITRVKLRSLDDPCFELYVDALHIDPAAPPFWQPISQPADFSKQLAKRFGPFETVGWSCMTHPYKDKVIDPITFMEDIEFTMKWREQMTMGMLADDDWRLFMSCLSTPDRVQHMMYQFYDEGHPLYDPEQASQEMVFFGEKIQLRDAVPAIYRQVDRIVGRVMDEVLRDGDTLLIGADHGFQSFRHQVHINNWLVEHGYLVLKEPYRAGTSKLVGMYADWSKTRAYSLGLGAVYLNLRGREPNGIVDKADAHALMEEIRAKFIASKDEDGTPYGSEVYIVEDLHDGPFLDLEGDMLFSFMPTYRVSWGTASGGISMKKQEDGSYAPGPVVVDNDRMWSGDHVSVDPVYVEGMFFSNRKFEIPAGGVSVEHIAPTVLSLFDVDIPPELDLPPLR